MRITYTILNVGIGFALLSCGRQVSEQENANQEEVQEPEQEERLPVVDNGEWVKLDYGENIGNYRNKMGEIYWSNYTPEEYNYYYPPFKGVDVESFRVCKGSRYAKDNKRVYYPVEIFCTDGMHSGGSHATKYVVKGADPATFKYIGNDYAVDSLHMYRNGKEIPWDNEVVRTNGEHYTGEP